MGFQLSVQQLKTRSEQQFYNFMILPVVLIQQYMYAKTFITHFVLYFLRIILKLTLNLLTTTIVAPPSNASNGRWDLIRRLKG